MIQENMFHMQLTAGEVKEEVEMTNEEALAKIAELNARIEEIERPKVKVAKNHRMGKASSGRKYVLLLNVLPMWGKVPQQQCDIAELLCRHMAVGVEYTEQEVFDMLVDGSGDYRSIYLSKQDPTYLFRYYRGLKNNQKHAGFVARGFIRQIG